jgi:hypothetical protein
MVVATLFCRGGWLGVIVTMGDFVAGGEYDRSDEGEGKSFQGLVH